MSETETESRHSPRRIFIQTFCIAFSILCLIHAAGLMLTPRTYFNEAVVEFSPAQPNSTASVESGLIDNLLLQADKERGVIESLDLQRRVVEELRLEAIMGKEI